MIGILVRISLLTEAKKKNQGYSGIIASRSRSNYGNDFQVLLLQFKVVNFVKSFRFLPTGNAVHPLQIWVFKAKIYFCNMYKYLT